ncbi:MAG: MFS transporter [Acidobacteria bacterium]|nr:MFS transporter [Acidobacteriota bacterium]
MRRTRSAPIWLMGMSNLSFGFFAGFITVPLPQLLAAQHVPEARIATLTATVFSGGIWVFLLGPMLDVRFSRRWYATAFAAIAALCLTFGLLNRTHLELFEVLMLLGFASAQLCTNALGGWLATIVHHDDEARLSSWIWASSFAGNGIMAVLAGEFVRTLPLPIAAVLLGLVVFVPTAIFLLMPSPAPDRRLARESFSRFFAEVFAVVRRREVLIALALFASPCASFALTNTLGGFGNNFHASARFVSLIGGAGLSLAGIFGSLVFTPFAKLLPLRPLYLCIGIAGAIFTAALLLLHNTPATFGLAMVGENVFQALAYTGITAIAFETIGRNNPLAATQYSLFNAASLVPIIYMQVIDGRAYTHHGVTGSFLADASLGILASALLGLMLFLLRRPRSTALQTIA